MTEKKKTKIGLAAETGGCVMGLSLIIWSIIIAILVGTDTTGLYQSMLVFTFLLPPLGSFFAITSAMDILKVIQNKETNCN